MARKVLLFYQDYFGIAYPLPKLDLVAISDFSAGAMENWGLITYRLVEYICSVERVAIEKVWEALHYIIPLLE